MGPSKRQLALKGRKEGKRGMSAGERREAKGLLDLGVSKKVVDGLWGLVRRWRDTYDWEGPEFETHD